MEESLPTGWQPWHTDPGGISVWVYRPDVFDGSDFPPACIPTLTVKPARQRGPRGRPGSGNQEWWAELRLEPDVLLERRTSADVEACRGAALELATDFVRGDMAYWEVYHEPPTSYLETIDLLLTETA